MKPLLRQDVYNENATVLEPPGQGAFYLLEAVTRQRDYGRLDTGSNPGYAFLDVSHYSLRVL
jgi:hypothetical protein